MTVAVDFATRLDSSPVLLPAENVAVDDLVREHLPLVGHLVREVAHRIPAHVDRDELTSAAMLALVTSAQNFDVTIGSPFGSFAAIRIRGALTDQLRSMDWASRSVRSRARNLDVTRTELYQSLGRTPTSDELADAAGLSRSELSRLEADTQRSVVLSTQALSGEQGAENLAEQSEGPESLILRREQIGSLYDAIASLPTRLKAVVEGYFLHQRRMVDIALELGVTESRVSQMRSEAVALLREALRSDDDRPAATRMPRSSLAQRLARTTALGDRIAAPVVA